MSNLPVNGSITELTKQYLNGQLCPIDVVKRELNKIKLMNRKVNPIAFMFDEKETLKKAEESAARYRQKKPLGPFDGVPITYKDDATIKGYRSTMSSFFLKTGAFEFMGMGGPNPPDKSEDCIRMFEESGAIPLCVSTTPECCCTEGCATFLNGVTRNPHNLMKSTGGSSGGAGALTALNIGYINMGSDMGGSIRIPSSFCGCYGIKPSYSIGMCGDVAIFPYFGCNGPLSQNMDNIVLYMQQIQKITGKLKGVDLSDKNVKDSSGINNLRVAVSKDLAGTVDYVDPDVWDGVLKVVNELKKLGAKVEFADPPINTLANGRKANNVAIDLISIEYAEYAKLVRQYKGGKYEKLVVPFLMKLCDKGAKVTGKDVTNAMLERDTLIYIMNNFMTKYDLLLTPATPIPARDTLSYMEEGYMYDRIDGKRKPLSECGHAPTAFTTLTNITQNPAIVIPTGFSNDRDLNQGRLPTAAMFVAPLDRDDLCLKVAYALQNKFNFIPAKL
eukprot:246331_1